MYGDGTDWNLQELTILGGVNVAAKVRVFDNGSHSNPEVYKKPLGCTLIFVPGALLRNGKGNEPADGEGYGICFYVGCIDK